MTFGLVISDPQQDAALRASLGALLDAHTLPAYTFVDAPAPGFDGVETVAAFLPLAIRALLTPGQPLPAALVKQALTADARPGNILRRYLFLQLSLLPYLRVHREVTQAPGGHLLGDTLFVAHLSEDGCADALLPPGVWTDLNDGSTHETRIRCMRSLNAMPLLAHENTLLPIGVNDRAVDADDADRLTLHWFEPRDSAACALLDGTFYEAHREGDSYALRTASAKPCRLIVHRGGEEIFC